MQVLACLAAGTALPPMAAKALLPTVQAQEEQENLAKLPGRLAGYLSAAVAGRSMQPALAVPVGVMQVTGVVICSKYDRSPEHFVFEMVRATASFPDAEYYDTVDSDRTRRSALVYTAASSVQDCHSGWSGLLGAAAGAGQVV